MSSILGGQDLEYSSKIRIEQIVESSCRVLCTWASIIRRYAREGQICGHCVPAEEGDPAIHNTMRHSGVRPLKDG